MNPWASAMLLMYLLNTFITSIYEKKQGISSHHGDLTWVEFILPIKGIIHEEHLIDFHNVSFSTTFDRQLFNA